MRSDASLAEADALGSGSAFVMLDDLARVVVAGADAGGWLHDLLTADVAGLLPDGARRTFLLTPTGRIRADLWLVRRVDSIELFEPADEPVSVATMLAPYVLGSDISLSGPTPVRFAAFPSSSSERRQRDRLPALGPVSVPSILGGGADVIVEAGGAAALASAASELAARVGPGAAETLRIRRGIPRWRHDVDPDAFPVGALADDAVAQAKGCFLGQEAVAKIRNLGHPPTVLRHLTTSGRPSAGDAVVAGGDTVGRITSAAAGREGVVVLARVRWDAPERTLELADGAPLRPFA